MSDGLKYLFTIVHYFTTYGWIVPFKDKATKYIVYIKNVYYNHNIQTTLQIDNETKLENRRMNQFLFERNIQYIFGTPYNLEYQGEVEVFTGQFEIF